MSTSRVGSRQLQTPNVLGDIHCTVSCNSIVKDLCGLAVGGSRNTRKVACVAIEDLAYS